MSDSESGSMRKVPLGGLATGLERQGAVTREGSTPLPSSPTEYWISCKRMSVWAQVDEGGTLVDTANITKKFVGQPFPNLLSWLRKMGGLRVKKLGGNVTLDFSKVALGG